MIGALREERLATNESRSSPSTTSPPVLRGDRLQELPVGLEPGELVGGGLGGPAGFALADGAVRRGRSRSRRRDRPRAAWGRTWPRTCRLRARRARRRASELVAAGQRDLEGDLGVVERPVLGVADPDRQVDGGRRARRPWDAPATSTRPGTSPTSQRTVCRHERSRSLSVGSSRRRPHRQRSPIRSAATCPLPNCCATSAGRSLPAASRTCAEDHGPRLDLADPAERLERAASRPAACCSSSSVFRSRTQGWSQPSRVRTRR